MYSNIVNAIKVSETSTQVVGLVMPGASTGLITITTAGGTATSSTNFNLTPPQGPPIQQGNKLVGTGAFNPNYQGCSVAVSADGNTAIVGGYGEHSYRGAVWIYTRSTGIWSQQAKLVGTGGVTGSIYQGWAVSISDDGNTAIVGGPNDYGYSTGATWIFTRSGGVWTQQGNKLKVTGYIGTTNQGTSVCISGDGNTAIIGGPYDNYFNGAAWIFTRSGGVWTQQGNKLVGTGNIGAALQGSSVSISADGNTATIGGYADNNYMGAVWIFTRSGGIWTQQGNKLVGTGNVGTPHLGNSVSISGDGNTVIAGGPSDNGTPGAAWVFVRNSGIWTQQGNKLVGANIQGLGSSISISADGNTAIVGAANDNNQGASCAFTRNGSTWTQQGNKLVGTGGVGSFIRQGTSVALSDDGITAIVGGYGDNNNMGAAWVYINNGASWTQQGNKLVGTTIHVAAQGRSVSLSADGNTAIVGGYIDNSRKGAAWVFTRTNGIWTQQGNKLVGTGGSIAPIQGVAVSLSADGNTAIVGGQSDSGNNGAVWIFTRNNGIWTQQGNILIGTGAIGTAHQGISVSMSADGNTAIVGGDGDNNNIGAAWIFVRSNGIWTQQGNKLVGTGAIGQTYQGNSVAISADGNTAIVGGYGDNNYQGASWVFIRSGNLWTQQGNKLIGSGVVGPYINQGSAVAISADGNTIIVGGNRDNGQGAVWTFTRSGSIWTQQGNKLVGTGAIGGASQGTSVSLSADGNTLILGGYYDNYGQGAAWVFTRNGGNWTQQGNKIVGTGAVGSAFQGNSVSISSDGSTMMVGGREDDDIKGAAWVFISSCITPTANAGTDKMICGINPVSMTPIGIGSWSGGAGTWNGNDYLPTLPEIGTTLTLTWTVTGVGSCPDTFDTADVSVFPVSTATIPPQGPITFCGGVGATVLQAPTGVGYTYQWKRGLSNVGSNTNTYTPTLPGNHKVFITDACGNVSGSTWINVIVNPLPQANAGPDKNLCDGSSVQIGANSALTYSYSWVPSTGLSNPLIAKPIANPLTNTSYTLYATDINTGCTNTDIVDISILPLPPTPSITSAPNGNLVVLTANSPNAASLYWYKNGAGLYANMAPNSSISVYHSNPTYAYTAKSKGANGCFSAASNALNVRIGQEKGGDELIDLDESILQAYPNPTNGILHVDIINLEIASGKIRLYNTLGQIILEQEVSLNAGQASIELDMSSFAAGVYSLSFENYVQKVVKE